MNKGELRELRALQKGLTDGNGTANTTLPLLHAQVRQEHAQDVLRTDSLGDVAERVDRRSSNRLLVRLEEVEELKADSHPLARRDELGSSVGDTSNEVDRRLLHLFVPVAKDGSHTRD